jgi:DNA replication factor GINS
MLYHLVSRGRDTVYDEIFEAWKREKSSEDIQPLPPDFLERASKHLADLKLLVAKESGDDVFDSFRKREAEYTEFMVSSLLRMRARKIFLLSLQGAVEAPANLAENEKSLFDNLRADLARYLHESTQLPRKEDATFHDIPKAMPNPATWTEDGSTTMLLRILQPIPRLVGVDLHEYGPFQQEDLVVLPKENALVLIARGVASEVRTAKNH